jgi:hypothetical protein
MYNPFIMDTETELRKWLRTLGALFPVSTENGVEVVKPWHKSIPDWLADEKKSGEFFVGVTEGHKRLAESGWREYLAGPATMDAYSLAWLPRHLLELQEWKKIEEVLCDIFFVEARARVGMLDVLQVDYEETLKIWDANTGREQATFILKAGVSAVAFSPSMSKIAVGDSLGNFYLFDLVGFPLGTPILTSVRLWLFGPEQGTGSWSPDITNYCPYCDTLFPTSRILLDTIYALNRNSNIGPDDSPCVKLPAEAWDEPKLLSECPKCKGKLKFNPFVMDNRG